MAINLLPSEHKIKYKKQKSASQSQSYQMEMTGAEKLDKNRPGIKKAGVLSFFKQSVDKPKEEKKDIIEENKAKLTPVKKVSLKQKITYKNIMANRPKVEYHVPERKPDSLKKKSGMSGKFTSIFDKDKKTEKSAGVRPFQGDLTQEQFPRYNSINAEKVLDPEHVKMKKTKVVEVTSGDSGNEKKESVWSRFKNWLAGIFSSSKKSKEEFKDPSKISNLEGFPKPKDKPISVTENKKIIYESQPQNEFKKDLKNIDEQIGLPKKPQEKEQLISYATPVEIEEEITINKDLDKPEEKTPYIPKKITYDNVPDKQQNIVANNFINESTNIKIDKVIKEEKDKQKDKPKAKQKKESIWNKFIAWLSGLFKRDKKIKMTEAPKFKKAEFEDKEYKIGLQKDMPKPQEIKAEVKPEETITKEESNIVEPISQIAMKEDAPVVPPPPKSIEQDIPTPPEPDAPMADDIVPPPPKDDKSKTAIDPDQEKMSLPMGFNGDQMNWEVNLIPEEAQEKEIPISKILILVMSMIIAIGVVFGGWLWADYYYNTISVTISQVDAEIANIQSDVALYENIQEEAKELQKKIENVDLLLEKHIYWSEFFDKLEFYTLSDVYYNNLTADVNGTITLTAVSDSYENAIKQLYVFKDATDFVTDVTISDIIKEEEITTDIIDFSGLSETTSREVLFNVNLTINPALFYYLN